MAKRKAGKILVGIGGWNFTPWRGSSTIANLDKVATISPMFKGALMLTMKDAAASEIQVSERQAKSVRELLQL